MQSKRKKRSRIRAAKVTAGKGHKKKNRGAGHRGGRGQSGGGKRGDSKIMKLKKIFGKHGFTSLKKKSKTITLQEIQNKLPQLNVSKGKDTITLDLSKLGYDKLLSKGSLQQKLHIKVAKASKNAVKNVEAAGGKIELI